MKTSLLYGAVLAMLGLATAPLIAQTQTTTSSTSSGYVQTSKIIGTKVKTAQGEEVGVVKDVVLDRSNGCMAYTVLSAGGTGSRVTGQAKMVAVPWSVYNVAPDASYLTVQVERDRIYNAPVFEYSRIGDVSYTNSVYSTFGVSAGGATTTTTGATTQTQTGAATQTQTGVAASSSASPGASMTPSASASATAAPTASASATASAAAAGESASPSKGTRAKAGTTPGSTSTHHKAHEATQGTSSESSAETAGSPSTSSTKGSKKASSAEKSTSTESSAESAESPSTKKSSHKKSGSSEGTETAPTPGEEQE